MLPILDMTDPGFWADIHAPLRAAVAQHPLARSPRGALMALGHAEVATVLRDPRFRATHLLARGGLRTGPIHDWWSRVMFSQNPPAHTRLRSLVSRAFTPRRVEALRPAIARIADDLMAPLLERGEIDLLHDYAHHLPIRVMGQLLGVPDEDYGLFADCTAKLGLTFNALVDAELRRDLEASLRTLDDYVGRLIEGRRREPGDDLLSALVAAEQDGDRLSGEELVAMVENLLFAGHDTTRSFLSIALPLLMRERDVWNVLCREPASIPAAVEECLRLEPPAFGSAREPAVEVELAGVVLPAGVPISVVTPAANRDPRVWRDPDRFELARFGAESAGRAPAALSFGLGIHACLGASLARAEGQIGIERVLRLTPDIVLDEEPRWVPFAQIRRYERVPARFSPRRL